MATIFERVTARVRATLHTATLAAGMIVATFLPKATPAQNLGNNEVKHDDNIELRAAGFAIGSRGIDTPWGSIFGEHKSEGDTLNVTLPFAGKVIEANPKISANGLDFNIGVLKNSRAADMVFNNTTTVVNTSPTVDPATVTVLPEAFTAAPVATVEPTPAPVSTLAPVSATKVVPKTNISDKPTTATVAKPAFTPTVTPTPTPAPITISADNPVPTVEVTNINQAGTNNTAATAPADKGSNKGLWGLLGLFGLLGFLPLLKGLPYHKVKKILDNLRSSLNRFKPNKKVVPEAKKAVAVQKDSPAASKAEKPVEVSEKPSNKLAAKEAETPKVAADSSWAIPHTPRSLAEKMQREREGAEEKREKATAKNEAMMIPSDISKELAPPTAAKREVVEAVAEKVEPAKPAEPVAAEKVEPAKPAEVVVEKVESAEPVEAVAEKIEQAKPVEAVVEKSAYSWRNVENVIINAAQGNKALEGKLMKLADQLYSDSYNGNFGGNLTQDDVDTLTKKAEFRFNLKLTFVKDTAINGAAKVASKEGTTDDDIKKLAPSLFDKGMRMNPSQGAHDLGKVAPTLQARGFQVRS